MGTDGAPAANGSFIRDVWADNCDAEFAVIREAIVNYPYVAMVRDPACPPRGTTSRHLTPAARRRAALSGTSPRHSRHDCAWFLFCPQDTEFPGVVARPIGSFKSSSDFHYQTLRCNVDLLKIIQIGLTLCNEEGELAPGICTYQFNFKFSLSDDIYSQDSINLLESSGLDFASHEERGIDPLYFAELLMSSGIVLSDDVKWITFHCGYDFGYLLKLLTCKPMPEEDEGFFEQLRLYFPNIYDIKYMMRSVESLKGGLNKLSEDLEVERIGTEHTAGSDSLLTQASFFKMQKLFFENEIDDSKYLNAIHGHRARQELWGRRPRRPA